MKFFSRIKLAFTILKGGNKVYMMQFYVAYIMLGRATVSTIPAQFREPVRAELRALGLDDAGKPLPVEEPTEE